MLFHVFAGKFDRHRHDLDAQHDAAELQREMVRVSPRHRVEPIEAVRPENQARKSGDGSFADIELLFDKERCEGKEGREDPNTSVSNVRFFNLDG